MRISFESIIEIDDTDGDMEAAMLLICQCGHMLRQHSWTTSFWYPDANHHTLYPSICVHCSIEKCSGFKVKQ